MSRTYRRKSGDRWFAKKRNDYVELEGKVKPYRVIDWDENNRFPDPVKYKVIYHWTPSIQTRAEFDYELINKWERDKPNRSSQAGWNPGLKWESRRLVRAETKLWKHRIMSGDWEGDFTSTVKGLRWYYW